MSKIYRYILVGAFIAAAFLVVRQADAAGLTPRLAASPTPTNPSNCIPVRQALNKKQIQLSLVANGELFYHKPVHYQITNLTTKDLVICFPFGQLLDPNDSSLQTLMVVDASLINAPAGQMVEGDLAAFCIMETHHAPQKDDVYGLGKMATGDLLKLGETIGAESASEHLGAQLAVWAITNNYSLDDLNTTAVPSSSEPSLTDSIKPLLCLGQDEITLGSKLLQDSGTGVVLYHGDNPLTAYCKAQGIPSLGQVGQQLKIAGIWAAVIAVGSALLCVAIIIVVIVLIIRLVRKRK
ncbi:MAG TPA: hypothetical protein VMC09_10260 [Anaerolineales bacterium]|nr:hypothetical protein [Anaerolineales bacterium]